VNNEPTDKNEARDRALENGRVGSGAGDEMAELEPGQTRLLVVDDDGIFRARLTRAFAARGLQTAEAADAAAAVEVARTFRPTCAVVDLRMPGRSGLDLVADLVRLDDRMKVVVLTAYGSITTAVEALHRGAINYLTKPADAEQILAAFMPGQEAAHEPPDEGLSLARVEWEHIQRTLADCGGNISEAARKLGIHRRSLQRKLTRMRPM
jgi:two-component system, response regulator RegA